MLRTHFSRKVALVENWYFRLSREELKVKIHSKRSLSYATSQLEKSKLHTCP